MSINFPNSPSVGQTFVFNNTSYVWDGSKWASSISVSGSTFSGDYDDLTNKPTIPINNNELTNGAGFITTSFTNTSELTNDAGFITTSFTNTSELTNGAGFITTSFTNTSELTNDAGFVTFTNNNQLTNGAEYITDTVTGDFTVTGNVSVGGTLTCLLYTSPSPRDA